MRGIVGNNLVLVYTKRLPARTQKKTFGVQSENKIMKLKNSEGKPIRAKHSGSPGALFCRLVSVKVARMTF